MMQPAPSPHKPLVGITPDIVDGLVAWLKTPSNYNTATLRYAQDFGEAILSGDLDKIHSILSIDTVAGQTVINPGSGGNAALRMAVYLGHAKVVRCLLQYSTVDPGVEFDEPLRTAIVRGHTKIIHMLLNDPRTDPAKIAKMPGTLNIIFMEDYTTYDAILSILISSTRMQWFDDVPSPSSLMPQHSQRNLRHIHLMRLIFGGRLVFVDYAHALSVMMWAIANGHQHVVTYLMSSQPILASGSVINTTTTTSTTNSDVRLSTMATAKMLFGSASWDDDNCISLDWQVFEWASCFHPEKTPAVVLSGNLEMVSYVLGRYWRVGVVEENCCAGREGCCVVNARKLPVVHNINPIVGAVVNRNLGVLVHLLKARHITDSITRALCDDVHIGIFRQCNRLFHMAIELPDSPIASTHDIVHCLLSMAKFASPSPPVEHKPNNSGLLVHDNGLLEWACANEFKDIIEMVVSDFRVKNVSYIGKYRRGDDDDDGDDEMAIVVDATSKPSKALAVIGTAMEKWQQSSDDGTHKSTPEIEALERKIQNIHE